MQVMTATVELTKTTLAKVNVGDMVTYDVDVSPRKVKFLTDSLNGRKVIITLDGDVARLRGKTTKVYKVEDAS